MADLRRELPMEAVRVEIAGTIAPVILVSRGPTISEGDIARFEDRLGYQLPEDYREFLLKYNGGLAMVGAVVGRDDDPGAASEHGDAIGTCMKLPGPSD